MVELCHKRCDHPDGCSTRPSFGLPEGSCTRCATHKEPGMVNLSGKHCDHPDGCSNAPSFGLPGGSRARCSLHKEPDMVNLCSCQRCDHPDGCSTRPSFGLPGGSRTRCATHKEPEMIDLSGKRCDHPDGCSRRSHFGRPGGQRTRCSLHKEPAMVNLSMKRCNHPDGCSKEPGYVLPGGSRTRCATHKEPGMVRRPCRPQAAGTSSDPVHGPQKLATTVGSTGGGGTGDSGSMGGGRRDCVGGVQSAVTAASSGDAPLAGRGSMLAVSPGQLPHADPDGSPSAASRGIRKRSMRAAAGERPRQDAPVPALVQASNMQQAARVAPRGVELPLPPQQATPSGPSVESPSGVLVSGMELAPLAGAACKRSRTARGSGIRATGPATERDHMTGAAQVVQAGASSQVQAPYILLEGDPNKWYRRSHAVSVHMQTE